MNKYQKSPLLCQAGIKSDDIMLMYEPEAAALYCRFQTNQIISNAKDEGSLSKKKKMLVFDMGGKSLHFIVINIMVKAFISFV